MFVEYGYIKCNLFSRSALYNVCIVLNIECMALGGTSTSNILQSVCIIDVRS